MSGDGEGDDATTEAGLGLDGLVERFLTPRPVPLTPRDQELRDQGQRLSPACGIVATAWGNEGGPAVLLAHGWESRGTHWGAFVPPLVAAGFRAVAVDAPAHGDSPGRTANVLQYGRALAALGDELGGFAGVVGHSFGAAAAAVALHLGLNARRAVLLSGPASLVALIARWGRHHGVPEARVAEFVAGVADRVGVPIEDLELTRLAPGLTVPALVVHDRGDDDVPLSDGLAVAAAWPGARTLITERFGHRRILIAREVVRNVVAFLAEPDA